MRFHRAQGGREPAGRRSREECLRLIREKIGPVAAFKLAIAVARLPKTRSGKILRGTMKKIADGEPWTVPATIDDPAILHEIGSALKDKGVGASAEVAGAWHFGPVLRFAFARSSCRCETMEHLPPYDPPKAQKASLTHGLTTTAALWHPLRRSLHRPDRMKTFPNE